MDRVATPVSDDAELLSGVRSYAVRNARLLFEMRDRARQEWENPTGRRKRVAGRPDFSEIDRFVDN
jgi:hypothetical protein